MAAHASLTSSATFRARERLRLTSRFWAVRRHGALARGRGVSIWALRNDGPVTRFGFRIQRGLKGSVERNRSKRLAREVIRKHKHKLVSGWDLIIVINRIHNISQPVLQEELMKLLTQLCLLK